MATRAGSSHAESSGTNLKRKGQDDRKETEKRKQKKVTAIVYQAFPIWHPAPRNTFKHVEVRKQIPPFTTLAIDDYTRWLCPRPTCTINATQAGVVWNDAHIWGFAVLDTPDSRETVSGFKDAEGNTIYTTIADEDVAIFANPSETAICRHAWIDGNGNNVKCDFDRLQYRPDLASIPSRWAKGNKEAYIDPTTDAGKTLARRRFNYAEVSKRFGYANTTEAKAAGVWNGSYICPKCSIDVGNYDDPRLSEWAVHATVLHSSQGTAQSGRFMLVTLSGAQGPFATRLCFVTTFGSKFKPGTDALQCGHQHFGYSPLENDSHTRCGYQYGYLPDFKFVEGLSLCTYPPYAFPDELPEAHRLRKGSGPATPEVYVEQGYPALAEDEQQEEPSGEQERTGQGKMSLDFIKN